MTDATTQPEPGPTGRGRPMPSGSSLLERLPGAALWELTVTGTEQLTPSMARIAFGAANLADLAYDPGQDLMFSVPAADGATFRRRYTIRRVEVGGGAGTGRLDVDIVLHGDGPGARWAAGARPGDTIGAIGPRGKILVDPEASWHLFTGDESAIPVTAAMVEALPAGSSAIVLLEVDGPADEQPLGAADGVDLSLHWLHRGDVEPGRSSVLADALAEVVLPSGSGHAYLNGELRTVNGLRKDLVARGVDAGQVSVKPYWRLGAANAAHGEPARD